MFTSEFSRQVSSLSLPSADRPVPDVSTSELPTLFCATFRRWRFKRSTSVSKLFIDNPLRNSYNIFSGSFFRWCIARTRGSCSHVSQAFAVSGIVRPVTVCVTDIQAANFAQTEKFPERLRNSQTVSQSTGQTRMRFGGKTGRQATRQAGTGRV